MARIFLAYRFRGEDFNELGLIILPVLRRLEAAGHEAFCSYRKEQYFRDNGMTVDKIYAHCLKEQENYDTFVAFVKTADFSQGMEWESNKAIELGQKYFLLIRRGLAFPHFRRAAHKTAEFKDYKELYRIIEDPDLLKISGTTCATKLG